MTMKEDSVIGDETWLRAIRNPPDSSLDVSMSGLVILLFVNSLGIFPEGVLLILF